jgi:hypothetical protein
MAQDLDEERLDRIRLDGSCKIAGWLALES